MVIRSIKKWKPGDPLPHGGGWTARLFGADDGPPGGEPPDDRADRPDEPEDGSAVATIPVDFLSEAIRHYERTGAPLLRYRRSDYATDLYAWECGEAYELSVAGWTAPTWREHAAKRGCAVEDLLEECSGILDGAGSAGATEASPDVDPDAPIPSEIWSLLDGSDVNSENAEAFWILERFLIRHFRCPEFDGWVDMGEIEFTAGPCPGNDYTGVSATSPLALSCLQYVLDERDAGIRVRLHPDQVGGPQFLVDAEAARQIVHSYLSSARRTRDRAGTTYGDPPEIELVDGADCAPRVRLSARRRVPMPPIAHTWVAYLLPQRVAAVQSSLIVLVSKRDGRVMYHGSAHDEG